MNYMVEKTRFEDLDKKIKAVIRKLKRYNLEYTYKVGATTVVAVNHYKTNPISKELVFIGKVPVEVVHYEFHMEPIKLGDWSFVAVIEHDAVDESEDTDITNIVHFSEGVEVDKEWYTLKSFCQHCNTNRRRKKTVILQDAEGNRKQVGSSCVKEFTGIEIYDILGTYGNVQELIEDAEVSDYYDELPQTKFISTDRYLAYVIQDIRMLGYRKEGATRDAAWNSAVNNQELDDSYYERAREVIDFFRELDPESTGSDWAFYQNIKTAVIQEYTKSNGYVAYAPIAMASAKEKLEEAAAELKEEERLKSSSQHRFDVGQRVEVHLKLIPEACGGFQSEYYPFGYTHIYVFEDEYGNRFKWFTGNDIDGRWESGLVKGTVKVHDSYNGVNETVLTRCKILSGIPEQE